MRRIWSGMRGGTTRAGVRSGLLRACEDISASSFETLALQAPQDEVGIPGNTLAPQDNGDGLECAASSAHKNPALSHCNYGCYRTGAYRLPKTDDSMEGVDPLGGSSFAVTLRRRAAGLAAAGFVEAAGSSAFMARR